MNVNINDTQRRMLYIVLIIVNITATVGTRLRRLGYSLLIFFDEVRGS